VFICDSSSTHRNDVHVPHASAFGPRGTRAGLRPEFGHISLYFLCFIYFFVIPFSILLSYLDRKVVYSSYSFLVSVATSAYRTIQFAAISLNTVSLRRESQSARHHRHSRSDSLFIFCHGSSQK